MNEKISLDNGLPAGQIHNLIHDVKINPGAIVSKTLRKSQNMNLTLFAFDAGQALSGHSSPMDAYVQVLSGEMNITIDQTTQTVKSGEMILMPAGINHALEALEPSKMLLTMVGL
jgi:quercetin dioxygenase-like cupin family protein